MKSVLTIAGSDSSGGAGIQADIKTMTVHGVFAQSVVTALTAQNTTGVQGVVATSPDFVTEQMDSVFSDIRPDAVKIGMLPNAEVVDAVAAGLEKWNANHIVLDPVMVATSGDALSEDTAVAAMVHKLVPMAEVITPNIPEAEVLSGMHIRNTGQMLAAAEALVRKGCKAVLVKGGHLPKIADDVLVQSDGRITWLRAKRIETNNTHGTGCTLSSAIASNLARGMDVHEAAKQAKDYITGAIENDPRLGHGNGPLNHMWRL